MEGFAYVPTPEEIEQEQLYWDTMDTIEEYAAWQEKQALSESDFVTCPLTDLIDELDVVRTLTPDQAEIIDELEAEIKRRKAA